MIHVEHFLGLAYAPINVRASILLETKTMLFPAPTCSIFMFRPVMQQAAVQPATAKQVPRFEPDRLRGLKSFELATFAMSVQLKFSCEFPIAKRLHALNLGQFGICT